MSFFEVTSSCHSLPFDRGVRPVVDLNCPMPTTDNNDDREHFARLLLESGGGHEQ